MRCRTPLVRLREIAEKIDYGVTASASHDARGTKFLRITDIQDGGVDWSSVPFCDGPVRKLNNARLQNGDIVFARTGATTGKSFLINSPPKNAVFASYLIRVRPSKLVDPAYLAHFFRTADYWSQIALRTRGAAQGGVNSSSLRELAVPLPPLDEQRRIAAILDKADALRQKRKQAISLLDSMTQAIFLEMFGDLTTSTKYKRGKISHWVQDFHSGKNLAADPDSNRSGGTRILKVSAVTSGVFEPGEAKPLPVDYNPIQSHYVKRGDLLFSRANTEALIGATAFVEDNISNIVLPDKIWRFVWSEKNPPEPLFIHALFSSYPFRREVSRRSSGTSGSMKNISKAKVLTIEVGLPSMSEQKSFVSKYFSVRNVIECARKQSKQLDSIFTSLQSRAFSGQL